MDLLVRLFCGCFLVRRGPVTGGEFVGLLVDWLWLVCLVCDVGVVLHALVRWVVFGVDVLRGGFLVFVGIGVGVGDAFCSSSVSVFFFQAEDGIRDHA